MLFNTRVEERVLFTHAAYLVATGVWPILHRRSFEAVSGRKRDYWLVRTVGGLATVIGLTLGDALVRGRRTREARVLAVGSSVVFAAADAHAARAVSPTYLLDLVVQPLFAAAWVRRGRTAGR